MKRNFRCFGRGRCRKIDGGRLTVLRFSICKLLPQKRMCYVRRRFFRPGAAEDVKGARRGATDAMVRRAYDEFAQFLHQTVLT